MKIVKQGEGINKYFVNKEYIANTYVMRCFSISMIVYCIAFLLNVLDIFIIDQELMFKGFVPSMIIYLIMLVSTKRGSLSSRKIKYFILLSIVSVYTIIGVTITYHVVIIAVLPILYSILYSSKKAMWYVYGLTVVSTIIIVYAGYYYGLCDANMALLTNSKLENYLANGYFVGRMDNSNPLVTLMLYFIIPRCLIYVAFMAACSNIYRILKEGLEKAYMQTVAALSEAVEAKDRYTSGHSKRVAEYSKMIAERMGKGETAQEKIYRAGLLHDVGKIRIPIDVINKPGKLTDEEYDLIKIHPVTGYHILREISDNNDIAVASKYHHERYDGKGYPNGLAAEHIPEIARILAVADSYDAMTSNRSYRKGLPQDVVRNEIEKGKGTQFDPNIADIMLHMIDEDKEYILRQIDKLDYKILLVGEDADCNRQVKDIIQEESIYEVIMLTDVTEEEVLGKISEQSFELIIWNIQTEQDKGWKILKTIKEIHQIPMVVVSDVKDIRATKELIEFGCVDYCTKPLNPLILKEIIYNMTEKCQ